MDNGIVLRMEEREKDWYLTSKILFSETGAINERAFLYKNISNDKLNLQLF